ncbi:aminoglycoside phosphotransferase family protein [Streptomyces sp. NPDC093109]|uniref:phosphotransferase family protein n=1 Tax=Streptomyces sp. NPDC093109 TaxID=3154977 RepID=UPI00344D4E6F
MSDRNDDAAIRALLAEAGLPADRTVRIEPVGGGTYNAVHRVVPPEGPRLVIKRPPPAAAPAMTYEQGLPAAEALYYELVARHTTVPVPEVVRLSGEWLLMTECPGRPWHEARPAPADEPRLRRELGALVARVHRITGTVFGYPSRPAADWRTAFGGMLEAVLSDADRYAARLPVPTGRIRALAAAAAPVLDEVTVPVPVHFDLWEGNVLLTGAGADTRIGALIDGERMFWGDPIADFVSLQLLGDPDDDPDLLRGYGIDGFSESESLRLALYQTYLYLIMLVEAVPRGCPPGHHDWLRQDVAPRLTAALVDVETYGG